MEARRSSRSAHPRARRPLAARALGDILAAVAALASITCSSPTDTGARRTFVDDSLLAARLSGSFATADTVRLTWKAGGTLVVRLETEQGPLVVLAGQQTSFEARGARADTIVSNDPPSMFASLDSLPIAFWLHGDSLVGFWTPGSVPRGAVSDSGVHWVTSDPAAPGCQVQLALFVPAGATEPGCRMALHWRPMVAAAAP